DATEPAPSPSPFTSVSIEAEAEVNSLSGSATITPYRGASGGSVVGSIGKVDGRPAGALQFNGVTVPSAGAYTLIFYYVDSSNQTALVSVDDAAPVAVSARKRNNCCVSKQLTVTLRAGPNTIWFGNPTAGCPAIDRIVVSMQ